MSSKITSFYKKHQEAIDYVFFGVLATGVNLLTFFFLDRLLAWPYLWANAVAIVLSILFAFVTNKRYVFRSKASSWQDHLQEFLRFISARLLSGGLDMLVLWILVDGLNMSSQWAKLLTQVMVVVLNYIFSKLFVFKSS